jgi:hypothetical protein
MNTRTVSYTIFSSVSNFTVSNSIEVDAKTKGSTRKTEEELDGRNKEGHEQKKPKRRPVGRQGAVESRCWTT